MKDLTKEWLKEFELHEIRCLLQTRTGKKIPLVFTNGSVEGIAKKDLHTVKTSFNVTDKENEISFIMVPDTFDYLIEYFSDATEPDRKSLEEDFLTIYIDRMRIITYLPNDILKLIKDKRMLAFGYAESEVKKVLLKYIQDKNKKALNLLEKSCEKTVKAVSGLTIKEQLEKNENNISLVELLDVVNVVATETSDKNIYLTLETGETLILSNAEVIEQEESPVNGYIRASELHNNGNYYELHLLLMKRDKNFIARHYYVTYRFKDMSLK